MTFSSSGARCVRRPLLRRSPGLSHRRTAADARRPGRVLRQAVKQVAGTVSLIHEARFAAFRRRFCVGSPFVHELSRAPRWAGVVKRMHEAPFAAQQPFRCTGSPFVHAYSRIPGRAGRRFACTKPDSPHSAAGSAWDRPSCMRFAAFPFHLANVSMLLPISAITSYNLL